MNFKSPKTSKLHQNQLSSPLKGIPKSNLPNKQTPSSLKLKYIQQESAQNSLMIKLIQTQISSQEQYQNLLIKNKQLEIKILQFQEQSQTFKKSYKKASKPLEEIKVKIESGRLSLVEKQKYLEKFYIHLDSKLKSNMHSNLFGKLQKIQSALQQKYQQQKQTLYSSLASQHENMQTANYKLSELKEYRDELIKQYTERAIEVSSNRIMSDRYTSSVNNHSDNKSQNIRSSKKSNHNRSDKKSVHNTSSKKSQEEKKSSKSKQKILLKKKQQQERKKKKQQKLLAKLQVKKQFQFIKENIQKVKKQKQLAQKDQKLLKQLLNIEEQHKKHSTHIVNGYKKMFAIQYRQMLSSRKKFPTQVNINSSQNSFINKSQKTELHQSSVSLPDVEGLQKKLSQKVAQRQNLEREIQQRNPALDTCKQKLNQEIGEYSILQEQIMRISNRNNSNVNNSSREANYRMTYDENQNVGNPRSTYTSYHQRSDHLDQDL